MRRGAQLYGCEPIMSEGRLSSPVYLLQYRVISRRDHWPFPDRIEMITRERLKTFVLNP
ncbi:hypothetical protein [Schlesneria paludicola]|uniref:hypothetical protein n=1 Tax=Schlesneria paludicola TaxID=360056 RepID=UPI0012F95B0D|nr:hypothetical protein [Schlesneria paludicola]